MEVGKPPQLKTHPFLEGFTSKFQSFSEKIFVAQWYFKIIIKQQILIQFKKIVFTLHFRSPTAALKVQ